MDATAPIKVMICGQRRRGKDTMADCLQLLAPPMLRAGFANSLKRDAAQMLSSFHGSHHPFPPDMVHQRDRYGPLWQWYGQWCREEFGDKYWIDRFDEGYCNVERIVVVDCRYANEAEYGIAHGFTLVRVTGPYRGTKYDTRDDDHPSERDVPRLPVHLEYDNIGSIADMQQWVADVLLPIQAIKGKYSEAFQARSPLPALLVGSSS